MSTPFQVKVDADHRRCIVGGEPMVFHCHHYNVTLQRTLIDAADYADFRPLLVGAAAAIAHAQLGAVFRESGVASIADRSRLVSELYRWAGFGTFDLGALGADGGRVTTTNSHYALGWKSRFGKSDAPVCFFASGFLAGALAAILDEPNGTFRVTHDRCCAVDGDACVFTLERGESNYATIASPGVGTLTTHAVRAIPETPVDYEGILAAVSGMPLVGDADGAIPAFGVYLTRHYANYYNLISFECLRSLVELYGDEGYAAAKGMLVEAGRVCAFNTFGGIMTSTEWNALIKPSLRTSEDWVHGMVAVANALGWGRWQVTRVSRDEAEFTIHDDYESVGHLAAYGRADRPMSFLAEGGVEGLMSLVYIASIADSPTLDAAFYESVFRGASRYEATALTSRAMGDEVTSFRVVRIGG